jgi:hypothetical protein
LEKKCNNKRKEKDKIVVSREEIRTKNKKMGTNAVE